jgi:DNA-binding transcriptional regulator YhcF (GntR family)
VGERTAPRYSRIVDELRGRIESGTLEPGDRIPSTRDIVEQWGVAMATATKVITQLRNEGLVSATPGVGTVVAEVPRTRRPRIAQRSPARDGQVAARIVEAAIAVADAEGLGAVSMRRVAGEIGVATMSLYRHVADKDALVMQMMNVALGEWQVPDAPPEGWRERLEVAGRQTWEMFRRHPWLAPAMSITRPQAVPNALPLAEWVLAALDTRGLDMGTTFTTYITLFNYVRGTAFNIEMEAEAQAQTGIDNDEWMEQQEPVLTALLTGGQFPTFSRLTQLDYDFSLDRLFEFGLQRLLDGLAMMFEDKTGPADGRQL